MVLCLALTSCETFRLKKLRLKSKNKDQPSIDFTVKRLTQQVGFPLLAASGSSRLEYIPIAPVSLFPPRTKLSDKNLLKIKPHPSPENILPVSAYWPPVKKKVEIQTKRFVNPKPVTMPLNDDLFKESLILVVKNQLVVLKNQDLGQSLRLGSLTVTRERIKETLESFLDLLQADLLLEVFNQRLREEFIVYPAGENHRHRVMITGYYTPAIKASRFKTAGYTYPIYQRPQSLAKMERIAFRRNPNDPYGSLRLNFENVNFTRRDIDGNLVLQNQNLEVAWLQSEMERYFLHIQGSGILEYLDGTKEGVQYAGSNGYSYYSVATEMLQDGVLKPSQGSMQGFKRYFYNHPQDIPKYLYQNKRYIFFGLSDGNPRGSSGAEVVANRSIATDPVYYAPGALAYIVSRKPILNGMDKIVGWKNFSRFVLNQDSGSAIKGPRRVDLYFGDGKRAGVAAGHYKERGKMFFLLKRN